MRCANQAFGLGPPGDDQERSKKERDFLRPHSFPLRSLRMRSRLADPLALSPLSLSDERQARTRFDGSAALLRNSLVARSACRHLTRLRRAVQGCRSHTAMRLGRGWSPPFPDWREQPRALPFRSQSGNSRPRVAGFARWPAPEQRFRFSLPDPSSPEGRPHGRVPMRLLP
jgi:hypothetical protein